MGQVPNITLLRQKRELVDDPDHLVFVRTLPCLASGREDLVEAHHLLSVPTGERGAARKSGDNWVIPLYKDYHWELHNRYGNEKAYFFDRWKFSGYLPAVAALFYQMTGDEQACRRAIMEMMA